MVYYLKFANEEIKGDSVKILAHLRMRPVSRGSSRHSLVGGDTCRKTPISRFTLDKIPMPGHLFEDNPFDEGTTRRGTDTPGYHPEIILGYLAIDLRTSLVV